MKLFRAIHDFLAIVVRPATVSLFILQLIAVAFTNSPLDWVAWGQLGIGRPIWMKLGDLNATFALVCLLICMSAWTIRFVTEGIPIIKLQWCVWLNVVTIAMVSLIPHIAVIY